MKTKIIHLRMPENMWLALQSYKGELASTTSGVIWIMIEHGLNYELKKKIRKKKQQRQLEEATVDQDKNNIASKTDEEKQKMIEIAKTPWI